MSVDEVSAAVKMEEDGPVQNEEPPKEHHESPKPNRFPPPGRGRGFHRGPR